MYWRVDHWVVQIIAPDPLTRAETLVEFTLDEFMGLEAVKYAAQELRAHASQVDAPG